MTTVEPDVDDQHDDDTVGAFYPGLTHSLYGESESGKSLIAQWAVIEALKAGERVLYVDFESNADQVAPRLLALAAGMGMSVEDLCEREPLLDYVQPQGRITQAFIDSYLTKDRYVLAIIDGVTAAIAMWNSKSNSPDEFTAWHHDLPERIARMTGAAVVVIDHVSKGDAHGRFATGTQAKMACLTGSGFLIDVVRPFAPGRPGEVIMRVGKDRPGDVRAHSGEVSANRLQPWARVTIDGERDGSKITLTFEAMDNESALDELPGDWVGDRLTWQSVVVPDEVGEMAKGEGKAHALDVLRIMWQSGTADGLTEAQIRQAWNEGAGGRGANPSSRWRAAWGWLDRASALSKGMAGGQRWVLSSNVEAMLNEHNRRP